ncbi:MAG: penicillin acylase family protein [Clostridia bacterium]
MRRLLNWLGFAVAAAGLALLGAFFYLRQSLPQTTGSVKLAGLAGRIEILRDRYAIPHIYAGSIPDAFYALGFVHAQDRLWQMEMSRRIGAGRLSEALGSAALPQDRFLRTLGVRRAAEANLRGYDAETRRRLAAYAAGVNAFLETKPVLPIEFWLTGVQPEPWSEVDSISWLKMMAWNLGGNWRNELLRLQLSKTLSTARIQELLPPYPGDPAPPLPDLKAFYAAMEQPTVRLARTANANGVPPDDGGVEGIGSNSWALAGARTESGKPLLANDPHLGLTAPPVWYFAHLHAPGLDVIGATLPGVPGVLVGRNQRIAWAVTNTGPDVQDLFLEKLDAAGRYIAPDGPRPFTVFRETIRVKGKAPEALTVRVSRHGPILSDVLPAMLDALPRGHAMAMQWTALAEDDRTMQAVVRVGEPTDWPGFLAMGRDFQVPQQNVSYADVDGTIAFMAAGRVPVRKPENDLKGLAPAPGWDARYDWSGFVPFEELPRVVNPGRGVIVTANQKITPPGYRPHITFEWEPPYRARRIEDLIAALPRHSIPSTARLQGDVVSYAVRELLEKLKRVPAASPAAAAALRQLAGWDGTMAADRVEPLIFVAWWRELARGVYADELGDAFTSNWQHRPQFLAAVFTPGAPQARWCDDVRTARTETCDEVAAQALERALADLRKRYGDDPSRWRWGNAHPALHEHRPFSRVKWLAPFFEIRVPSPGGAFTVDVGRPAIEDTDEPYASRHAPSLRAIYDLSDPERSLFIHSGGQSGNVLSPHYRTFTEAWARVEYVPMRTDRARIEQDGVQRLVLEPR